MKNYAMPAAIATVGLGLLSIGFNLNGNQANATPAAFNAGPVEPTIVWYEVESAFKSSTDRPYTRWHVLYRGWSDSRVERRAIDTNLYYTLDHFSCEEPTNSCKSPWEVVSSANEGINAAADINFDERVDAADLGLLVAAWGDAPRNDYPPSDCPLGLIP